MEIKPIDDWAYYYCIDIEDDPEIRKYITDPDLAFLYCIHVKDRPEVRKYITDPMYAHRYCKEVRNDIPELKILSEEYMYIT